MWGIFYSYYDIWPDWVYAYSDEDKWEMIDDERWHFLPFYPYWVDTNVGHC